MRSLLVLFCLLIFFIPTRAQNFRKYKFDHFHTKNSELPNNHIRDIYIDSKGRTWVSSMPAGLHLYDPETKTFENKIPPDFYSTWWLNDIEEDKDGNLIIAGHNGYMVMYKPDTDQWDSIPMPEKEHAWFVGKNYKGTFLVSTTISTKRLYQWRNGEFELFEDKKEDVMGLDIMENGDAYVSYRSSLYLYPMNPDGTYSSKNGVELFDRACYGAIRSKTGSVWIATFEGTHLFEIKDEEIIEYKNLPEEMYYDFNDDWKYVIYQHSICPDGNVMIGTQFGMFFAIYDGNRWDSHELKPLRGNKGVNDAIERMVWDPNDNSLWLGTQADGLYHWYPTEKEELDSDSLVVSDTVVSDITATAFLPDPDRKVLTAERLTTYSTPATIDVWDSQRLDGDTVSIYVNGELVLEKYLLLKTKKRLAIELKPGDNEILLYAHNLGEIPPNTMAVNVEFEGESHRLTLRSDEDICERLIIHYVPNKK